MRALLEKCCLYWLSAVNAGSEGLCVGADDESTRLKEKFGKHICTVHICTVSLFIPDVINQFGSLVLHWSYEANVANK